MFLVWEPRTQKRIWEFEADEWVRSDRIVVHKGQKGGKKEPQVCLPSCQSEQWDFDWDQEYRRSKRWLAGFWICWTGEAWGAFTLKGKCSFCVSSTLLCYLITMLDLSIFSLSLSPDRKDCSIQKPPLHGASTNSYSSGWTRLSHVSFHIKAVLSQKKYSARAEVHHPFQRKWKHGWKKERLFSLYFNSTHFQRDNCFRRTEYFLR